MKSSLVPIACGTVLALMAGAAASHWSTVQDMATLAAVLPANLTPAKLSPPPAIAPLPDDGLAREAQTFLAETRRSEDKAARPSKPAAATDAESRFEKVVALLEGTADQNQELRERLAETNRDLMELRFQIDSYDGQFRPLVVEQEPMSPYDDGSGGVLPPLETP